MIDRIVAALRSAWWILVRRERAEQSLDDELRTYVDLLAAEYERNGIAPEVARRQALIDTGGVEQVKELTRDAWVGSALSTAWRELRYAFRTLRRAPTFLAVAIATLAIGIGGATAVFTVIKASLLQPLPATTEPDRLVAVERIQQTGGVAEFSYPDFRDLAGATTALTGLAGFNGMSAEVQDRSGTGTAWVSFVTDEFFSVLGVRPIAGRFFAAGVIEREPVVVLGHAIWLRRFGGSSDAVGSKIKLNNHTFTVVGIAPAGFIGAMSTHRMEMWIPTALGGRASPPLTDLDLSSRRDDRFRLIGRLAPGRSLGDAERDLTAITKRLAAAYPTVRGRTIQVLPRTGMTAEERADISRVPRLLAAAVAMLLLIACGNVASLCLVRAAARRREFATRVALGASRASLGRQIALEGLLVAIGAGVVGVLLARILVRSEGLVRTVVSIGDPDLTLDVRVLMLAITASTLTAVLVSLLPAMQLRHLAPIDVMKIGGGVVRGSSVGQRVLVAAQVAASLVLLAGAGIIYSAFHHMVDAHAGLDPRGIIDVAIDARRSTLDTARQVAFFRDVLTRLADEPSISGAAFASTVPPFQWAGKGFAFRFGEDPPRATLLAGDRDAGLKASVLRVSETFFDVMRIPLLRGRAFTAADDRTAERVVIVNRRLAGALWPSQPAVGQMLAWPSLSGPPRPPMRVVGIVENTRDIQLSEDPPLAMYVPFAQHPNGSYILILRGRADLAASLDAARRLTLGIDPVARVSGGRPLIDRLNEAALPQRRASAWVGVFALIAILLATVGLYGVIAQSVLQRTRELAVRSALGATPHGNLGLILRDGMRLTAAGLLIGAIVSFGTVRLLGTLFAGVRTGDVRPAAIASAALAMAMFFAAYLPARRAASLNPADALRSD